MKKTSITILLFLAGFSLVFSQDCSKYYLLEEGATFQYTNYNKKGKSDGVIDYSVSDVSTNGEGMSAQMNMKVKDKKGDQVAESSYTVNCSGDKISIDFESLLSSEMMKQYEGMEAEVSGTDIELPNNLEVGQELPDASVALKIGTGGINMNITVDMVNRKVEKKESVTTPAGTFDCYVIYSESKTKLMMSRTFPTRMWLTEGIGMVKQENYNKAGKVQGSTVLTAYSR